MTTEKQTRVRWNADDWGMLAHGNPALAEPVHDVDSLTLMLRETQEYALPEHRHMKPAVVRNAVKKRGLERVTELLRTGLRRRPDTLPLPPHPHEYPHHHEHHPHEDDEREPAQPAALNDAALTAPAPAPAPEPEPAPVVPASMPTVSRPVIRWRPEEYTAIAVEIKEHLRKGHEPTPIALVRLVMEVQSRKLPPERRRSQNALYQACFAEGGVLMERLREGMKTQAGLHKPLYIAPPPVVPAAPAPIPVTAAPNTPAAPSAVAPAAAPETPEDALVALARSGLALLVDAVAKRSVELLKTELLKSELVGLIETTVRNTVTDLVGGAPQPAAEAPPPQPQPESQPAEARTPDLALVPPTPRKPRVDVVGLLGVQAEEVRRSVGNLFDLRFVTSDSAERQRTSAENVVICTKFVQHSAQDKVKANGGRVLYANGAAHSVIERLRALGT